MGPFSGWPRAAQHLGTTCGGLDEVREDQMFCFLLQQGQGDGDPMLARRETGERQAALPYK